MPTCLLALGSNLGQPHRQLTKARTALADLPRTRIVATSRWHATLPVGGPSGQPIYCNGAVRLRTELGLYDLWHRLEALETELGRHRDMRWGPRQIDIDLLMYGSDQVRHESLVVPHPRMLSRRFVLSPAAEVGGDCVHPESQWTLSQHAQWLANSLPYIAVASESATRASTMAAEVARRLGAECLHAPDVCQSSSGDTNWNSLEWTEPRFRCLARFGWRNMTRPLVAGFCLPMRHMECTVPRVPRPRLLILLPTSNAHRAGGTRSLPIAEFASRLWIDANASDPESEVLAAAQAALNK